jgi:hypothetical protein
LNPLTLELRVFVDYWNFTARWRDEAGADQVCWAHLLPSISAEAGRVLRLKKPAFQGVAFNASARLYSSAFNPSDGAMTQISLETGLLVRASALWRDGCHRALSNCESPIIR